jgi:uncharacterized CHY-type Zn-finger protein
MCVGIIDDRPPLVLLLSFLVAFSFRVTQISWSPLFCGFDCLRVCLRRSVGLGRAVCHPTALSTRIKSARGKATIVCLSCVQPARFWFFGVCFFRHGTHPVNSKDTTSSSIFLKHVIIAILARQLSSSLNYLDKNRCRFCIT